MTDPTPLRDNAPLVSDIPGQLRRYADLIDAGRCNPHSIIVIGLHGDSLADMDMMCWGEHPGDPYIMATLDVAKARYLDLIRGVEGA